jgi:hypothetical protein
MHQAQKGFHPATHPQAGSLRISFAVFRPLNRIRRSQMRKLRNARLLGAAVIAICASTAPASASEFIFDFSTTTPLIGGSGSGSGSIFTDDITVDSRGFTAQTITGINGTFNGSTITGLATPFGANNLYYVTGPSFVDGSGLGFVTAAGTNVNLFFQDSVGSYRINTTSPFTSSFVQATSSEAIAAVPEPATWAMMLLGFGAIGFQIRRVRSLRRSAALG